MSQHHFYFTAVLMFKARNSLTSVTICNRFENTKNIHNYHTRFASSNTLHPQKPRTNYLKRTLSYKGVEYWNKLTISMKESKNLYFF